MGFYLAAIAAGLVVLAPAPSSAQTLGDPPAYQQPAYAPPPGAGPGVTAGRVWAEIGLGFALDLIPAAIAGGGILLHCETTGGQYCAIGGLAIYGSIAAAVGLFVVPLGVLLGGHALGGSGGYGWSILGGLAGAAIGWSFLFASAVSEITPLIVGAGILLPALHIGGAIIGYELSSDDNRASAGFSFAPSAHGFDARFTAPL